MPASEPVSLAVALGVNDPAALERDLEAVYDPASPEYGHYLTPDEFTRRYSPSEKDFGEVLQYLNERGLTVTATHPNRLVIDVEATAGGVEQALGLELHQYQMPDGRVAHASLGEPLVSDAIASRVTGFVGLSSIGKRVAHVHQRPATAGPAQVGTGPGGGLVPSDLRTIYQLSGLAQKGTGQTMALFELDGYTASDISGYAAEFGIAGAPALQNVLVDGVNGAAGSGAVEVTLDIELMMAVAPGATKIMVYEGPNSDQGVLDTYAKMANDNLAKELSTSWGAPENQVTPVTAGAESMIFQQMAMQGQTIYAAAGDSGAFDDGTNLVTDDPASGPYMVAVGGTKLAVGAAEAYSSESSWGTVATSEGGGGGISAVHLQPSWQAGVNTAANLGSAKQRMVPDVSLVADPNTGYVIFFQGANGIVGGTSCAAPMWAGFSALVNQQRAAAAMPLLGFPNPALYRLGPSSLAATVFHDVKDGTTNLHYPAVTGYDLATGWGSFNGAGLFAALTAAVLPTFPPQGLAVESHNKTLKATWPAVTDAVFYTIARGTSASGPFTTVATPISATTFLDGGLSNGTTYYYVVNATNAAGVSGNSIPVSGSPTAMAPEAPTALAVTGVGSQ
jgi:kumamolisin